MGGCKPRQNERVKQNDNTMAKGHENLIPPKTKEEARARGSNGGIASGIAKRKKKTLREAMQMLLSKKGISEEMKALLKDDGVDTDELTHQVAIGRALIEKAESGDVSAYNAIRDIVGEKPADNLAIDIPKALSVQVVNVGGEFLSDNEQDIK